MLLQLNNFLHYNIIMKLSVNIPRAIMILRVVFYVFIIVSHFTKNLREGLENNEDTEDAEEDLEETQDETPETEGEDEEESTFSKMTRLDKEIDELQKEIDDRNVQLDELRKTIGEGENQPASE